MSRVLFDRMQNTFSHKMELDSEWVVTRQIAILTRIEPIVYHCCINSCLAFTGHFTHHQECEICKEPCYAGGLRPRATFVYLPLIPRLQGFFQSPAMIARLSYRSDYKHEFGYTRDVFDGLHYCRLKQQNVVIDGVE